MLLELPRASDKVRSSWLAVQLAALELNTACEDVRAAPGLGGAYTYVDNSNLMKITLKGAGAPVGDGDDGTDANETS